MDDRFASDSIRDRQFADNHQLNSPFAAHTWIQQEQQQQSWPPIAATTAPPIHTSSSLPPKFSSTSSSSNVYIPPQRRQSAEVTSSSNQSSANWDTVPGWSSKNLSQFNQNDPRSNLPQRGDWSSSSAIPSGWSNNPAISPIHNPAASLRQSIPPVAWQGPDHRPADRELPDIHAWDKERNPALASTTNYSRADWTVPSSRGPAPNFTNSRSDWAGPASNLNPSKGDWSAPPASARGEWSAPAPTNSRSEWSKLERSDWTASPSSTPRSEWSSGINREPSTQRSAWTGPTSNPTIAPRNDWSGTVRSHDPPLPPTNPSRNPNWDSKSEWGAPVKPTVLPAGWNSQSRSELSARSEARKARPQSWMAPSAHSTPAAPSGWNCRPEPLTTGRESNWAYTNQKWKEGSSEVRSSGWGENPTVKKGWNEEPDSPHHPNRGKGWEEAHGGPVISGWDNQEPEPQQHALRKTRSTPYFEGSKNSGSQIQRNAFTASKRPPLAPVIEAANTGCFVYGFPVWVRVKELIDVFGEFGSVINVGIKGDPPYAFVDYETTGCIERARQGLRRRLVFDMNVPLEISPHEKNITTYPTSTSPPPRPERLIPPQRSVPTQQPPQKSSTPISSETVPIIKVDKQLPDAKTIHLGNLPVEVTKSQIEELFSKYGSVTKIQLITRPDRAFGFVTFETIASCHKAFKIVRSSRQFYFNMKEQLRVEFSKAEQQQKNEKTKSSTSTDRENPVPANTLIVKTVKKTNDGVVVSSERRLSNPEKPSPIEPEFVKITNRKESGVKNRNIIFVPDVPADTAQQEFLEQFIAFGKIDAYYLVQRVTPAVFVEKSKTTTEPLPTSIGRFAVVSYHSPESAGKAVASNTFGADFPRQRRLFLTNVPSFVDKDGVLSWLGLTVKDFRKFESCPNENESLLDVCSYDLDFHRSDVALKSLFKALGSLDHFSKESPLKIEYAKSIRKEQVPINTTTVPSTIISKSVFAPLEDDSQEKSPSTPDTSIADASTVGDLSDDDEVTLATEIVEEHVSYNKQKVKICEEDLIEFRNGIESEVVLLEDLKNVGNTHVETDFVALDQLEGDSSKINTEIVTLDDLNDSNNVNTEVITLDELNDTPSKINTEIVTLDDLTTSTTAVTMDLLEKSCAAVAIETELVSLDDLIVCANEIENEQRA